MGEGHNKDIEEPGQTTETTAGRGAEEPSMTGRPRTEEKRAATKRKRQRAMSKVHGGTKATRMKMRHQDGYAEMHPKKFQLPRELTPGCEVNEHSNNHAANPDGNENDAPGSTP